MHLPSPHPAHPHHTRAPQLALTGCHSFVSPAAEAEKHMLKKKEGGYGGREAKRKKKQERTADFLFPLAALREERAGKSWDDKKIGRARYNRKALRKMVGG